MRSDKLGLKLPACGIEDQKEAWDDGQKNPSLSKDSRLNIRAHFKCPCDKGCKETKLIPLSRLPGKWLPGPNASRMADAEEKKIEAVMGFRPGFCPYQAFLSPVVAAVFEWRVKLGINPSLYNESLPMWLYEALALYEGSFNKASNHFSRKEIDLMREENRKRQTNNTATRTR